MYVIKGSTIVPVESKKIIVFGAVQDPRIVKVESVVAHYFNTTIHELNVFYHDTDAKVMCCFLLHDMFCYSLGCLAKRYNIDRLYLRNRIMKVYQNCLLQKSAMKEVVDLRNKYLEQKKALQPV